MAIPRDPIWLSVARAFIGLVETPGPASNPVILRWAADIGAPAYTDDGVAWCAVFVNRILLACGLPLSGRGYSLLRAGSFRDWGQDMPLGPAPGAVLVFSRPEGHHVGFYVGEDATRYRVLGGNQIDAVSETWINQLRLVAMRWPDGVERPFVGRVVLTAAGATSTNEG